jgi:hypothetical protein
VKTIFLSGKNSNTMNSISSNTPVGRFPFRKLSIRQRLTFSICILLLVVIATFGYTSYLQAKGAALSVGKERLNAVTGR